MNTFTVAVCACLATLAVAKPSGLLGLSVIPHATLPLVGASGVVSSNGAAGPAGVVTGNGAVGPSGEHNAIGPEIVAAAPAIIAAPALAAVPALAGLGLAGHLGAIGPLGPIGPIGRGAIIAGPAGTVVAPGLGLGHGIW